WLQLVCPFLFLHPKQKKGTNNQSRERVVISTKYFRTLINTKRAQQVHSSLLGTFFIFTDDYF
ncbi:hypothetical protein, partial [Weissella confusa]|uniref:hypothetical protein n=1 Tax=Weissella confusa TaxID=1583 RepID=UPI001A7F0108